MCKLFGARKGSITLLAFVVLGVLLVIGLAFNESSTNAILQVYRFKVMEKSLGVGDAVAALTKKIVEEQANTDGSVIHKLLTAMEDNKSSKCGPKDHEGLLQWSSGSPGGLGSYEEAMSFLTENLEVPGGKPLQFDVDVKACIEKDGSGFPSRSGAGFRDSSSEFKGKVHLRVTFTMEIFTEKSDGSRGKVKTAPRVIESAFEFKRVRIQPPVIRDFTLFVQDATKGYKDDVPGDYENGKFNRLVVDGSGQPRRGYFLNLDHGIRGMDAKKLIEAGIGEKNPFYSTLGYVLLGTGGEQEKGVYLNLTAGNSQASETFHLYRGDTSKGESDFYQLYSGDYATMLDAKDEVKVQSNDHQVQFNAVKKFLESEGQKLDYTSGMAFYYMARKDYGYADDWKKHPEFGFSTRRNAKGEAEGEIPASSLHLFGSGDQPSFSVVFGNVFRRCLSLTGYKQVKVISATPKGRTMETQAGPLYYYRDFEELHRHKLYLNEKFKAEHRQSHDFKPIEVWDGRVNWIWGANPKEKQINAAWIYISGDGLMGRLIPAIKALYTSGEGEKIYEAFVGAPKFSGSDARGIYERMLKSHEDGKSGSEPYVSPLLQAVYEQNNKQWPTLLKEESNRLDWTEDVKSAYFRELLIHFYYNSMRAAQALGGDKPDCSKLDSEMLKQGCARWNEMVEMVVNSPELKKKYTFTPPSGWMASSKVAAREKYAEQEGGKFVHYFTLPDPWVLPNNNGTSFDRQEEAWKTLYPLESLKKSEIGKAIENLRGESSAPDSGGEALFDKYFRGIMTDPAWVLPYNQSARFFFDRLRQMYFTTSVSQSERTKFFKNESPPEFRDAIGHIDSNNKYMESRGKKVDNPIGPELQKAIVKQYFDKPREELPGYFFVAEMSSVKSLEELDLAQIFEGRCSFHYASDQEFFKAYPVNDNNIKVNTTICIDSGHLKLPPKLKITGPGAIYVAGPIEIQGDLEAADVVLFGQQIKTQAGASVSASLVQRAGTHAFKLQELNGNLAAPALDRDIGNGTIRYSEFWKGTNYVTSFQPYLSSWGIQFEGGN